MQASRLRPSLGRRSVATQVLVLQVVVIVVLAVAAAGALVADARRAAGQDARTRALAVAQSFADSPGLLAALRAPDPSPALQPRAEAARRDTGVDFIVVMSPRGLRYTHPDPSQIGHTFLGHIETAVRGRAFTETYTGTLGPSVRAIVPVFDEQRHVVALVAAGITVDRVSRTLRAKLVVLLGAAAVALLFAAGGTILVSRRLRRQTRGLGPEEITRMYEHHDAVLHAVHEGLLVVDTHHRLLLANDEAVRLLELPPDATGRPVNDLSLDGSLLDLLTSGRVANDEVHLTGDAVLAVNQRRTVRDGQVLGTVTTLRDTTELRALTGELDSIRGFTEALRAQAHEAANRLHTVVTLVELGREREAVEFGTAELAASQVLTDRLLAAVDEPVLAALLLGKAAQAHQRGVELDISGDTAVHATFTEPHALVTLVGNLVDNAIDAAGAGEPPRRVTVSVRTDDDGLVIRVADTGAGIDEANLEAAFRRGWSTKIAEAPHGRGLGLALVQQVVHRHDGRIEVGRDRAAGPADEVDRAGGAVFTVRLPRPAVPAAPAGGRP
ncbi:sensor histidine kinase [Pseudofrankia saprophytica]|uniref:sensor histidine kinase n=1 Tax=Pseudofrankia saprophytica TaxID=298655 RepID=UPI00068428F4|nr:sensor histidine kinase [Pseudofrankia saprophytica]OHV29804.1 histidine kinase [Pseudofrankia sp. EUN1h]